VTLTLSDCQLALVQRPIERKIFLEGPAGAGKTSAGVERLLHLLDSGVSAGAILVLVPQRTLAAPYYEALSRPTVRAGGRVAISTLGGLAQRMVDLFWPLIAEDVGFARPDQSPTFLTLETAQYYMARLVQPLLDQGYFETVVIDRNRLYSQIIDNLNKSAVVGFPYAEIGERLKAAWGGERGQAHIYDEAQVCATRFREYCLAHNLLDFSLQLEVFVEHLWSEVAALPPGGDVDRSDAASLCRDYLLATYTHLLVDNVEEDTPVAHDVLREWLPRCRSALVICDHQAGYRRFLGADPQGARALRESCDEQFVFTESFVTSPSLHNLAVELAWSLNRSSATARTQGSAREDNRDLDQEGDVRAALTHAYYRYYPQMLDWVTGEIARLVHEEGVPAGEIVVLAPFLTDALRFSLVNRLERLSVPTRSHRPSRALREEPPIRCLLTLAAIAHPGWGICPSRFDVAYALMQAIDGMDLVRAQLLADIAYRVQEGRPGLGSFDRINPDMQERLTFVLGERYERLRGWIADYVTARSPEFDHFLSQLFGEVLSQQGYGFHRDYDAGRAAANLIESVRKFRWATVGARFPRSSHTGGTDGGAVDAPLGREYLQMVRDGVIAAQYVAGWQVEPGDAVLLAPAYTFLMANRPVDHQFWLNVGGSGWWERLYQPLTHPYVLSRRWPADAVWSDTDEVETRRETLYRLTTGLVRRCRRRIYLGMSELGEQGYEQKGPLLQAIQHVLRRLG